MLFVCHFLWTAITLMTLTSGQSTATITCDDTTTCAGQLLDNPSGGDLNIYCTTANSCEGATINVAASASLFLECSGSYSCYLATVNGPQYGDITIECLSTGSCRKMDINADSILTGTFHMLLDAQDADGYGEPNVQCPGNNNDCFIDCLQRAACTRLDVTSQTDTRKLTITVGPEANSLHKSYIRCNSGPGTCEINIIGTPVDDTIRSFEDTTIYASNGFESVTILCDRTDSASCISESLGVTMNCGTSCDVTINDDGLGKCENGVCMTQPTSSPSKRPTPNPSDSPTSKPTVQPSDSPTNRPSPSPTLRPTPLPSKQPTLSPTPNPTPLPSLKPTVAPTKRPTPAPTDTPSKQPTSSPTAAPSTSPSAAPSIAPSGSPTTSPSGYNVIDVGLEEEVDAEAEQSDEPLETRDELQGDPDNGDVESILYLVLDDVTLFIAIGVGLVVLFCLCCCALMACWLRLTRKKKSTSDEERLRRAQIEEVPPMSPVSVIGTTGAGGEEGFGLDKGQMVMPWQQHKEKKMEVQQRMDAPMMMMMHVMNAQNMIQMQGQAAVPQETGGFVGGQEHSDDSEDSVDVGGGGQDGLVEGTSGGLGQTTGVFGDAKGGNESGAIGTGGMVDICCDCGKFKKGVKFDGDGQFYCMGCWIYYEQAGADTGVPRRMVM